MLARLRQWMASHRLELLLLATAAGLLLLRILVPTLQELPEGTSASGLLPGRGGSHVLIGSGRDLLGTLWTFDYAGGLLTGANSTVHDGIFVPMGFDLGQAQGFAWIDAWLASPLVALLGMPGFYNAHVLLAMMALLVGLHLLLRQAGTPAAVAVGLAFAVTCSPYMLRELFEGRPTQLFLLPHLGFVAAAWGLVRARVSAVALAVGAGLLLAMGCLVYWFSGVAVGLVTGIAVAAAALTHPQRRLRVLGGGLLLSVVALLAALAPTWRMARELGSATGWMGGEEDTTVTLELLGVLPLTLHARGQRRFGSWYEFTEYLFEEPGMPWVLGAVTVVALLGLRRAWREQLPWLLALAATFTLAMFPVFTVADGAALPSARGLLELVFPPIIRCHQPNRLAIAPMLAMAMTAGLGARGLLSGLSPAWRERIGLGVAVVCFAGTLAEPTLLRPLNARAVEPFPAAPFYEQATEAALGGIIDVPLEMSIDEYAYQVVHERPLLGGPGYGYPKVQPAEHVQLVAANSFLRFLEDFASDGTLTRYHPAHLAALREAGLGIIVVHGKRARPSLEQWEARLGPVLAEGLDQRWAFALPQE